MATVVARLDINSRSGGEFADRFGETFDDCLGGEFGDRYG